MRVDKLHITLAGREHVVEAGTTAGQALELTTGDNEPAVAGAVIAARVSGELRDLGCPLADGDTVSLSLNSSRQKTKNLKANPAVSLLILDLAVPYRYLELRGDAEITADDDYSFANRVGEKYHANLSDHDQPGEKRVVVTIRPVRVHAVDMRS